MPRVSYRTHVDLHRDHLTFNEYQSHSQSQAEHKTRISHCGCVDNYFKNLTGVELELASLMNLVRRGLWPLWRVDRDPLTNGALLPL